MNTILIIDDLKGDLLLVKNIIEENIKDPSVLIAYDGRMGLQLAKAHRPDAIILDIYMPKMDGFEVSRRLKANKETRNIPIIMFTGNLESSGILAKGLDAGADIFIYKPIRRIELIAQLNAVLRIKKAEDLIVKENQKLLAKTEELNSAKTFYKNFLSDLPVAMVIHSEGKIVYANPKTVQLAGASSYKDLLGRPITEFIHDDYLTTAVENLKNYLTSASKVIKSEARFKKLDGSSVYAAFTATKTYFDNKLAIQLVIEDISEQNRVKVENENLIHQMLISEKLSKSGSWRFNIVQHRLSFSDNLLKIHDLSKETFDGNPETLLSYIHPDDRDLVSNNTKSILQKNRNYNPRTIEYRIITAKGIEKTVLGTALPIKNPEDATFEIIGSVRDITEEKQAAQKLKESEERFGITFELNPDPVTITAIPSGKYVAVNRAFEIETGYSKNEIIGKTTQEVGLWADDNERVRLFDQLKKSKKGEIKGFETQFTKKNGKATASLLSGKMIQIEDKSYLLSIVKNIQALKDNERILTNEREKLRAYINVAQVVLVVIDRHGDVVLINKKGCEVLGYPEEKIIGTNWFDNYLPESTSDKTKKVFNQLLKNRTKLSEYYDNSIIRSNGEERLIAWHNAVITDENNQVTGVLSSGDDVTDLRIQEQELFLAKEKALESDRLKSAFLANMSHEIRTPMNAIIGFTQLLKEEDFSEEERENFVDIISKSGQSLLDLINDIIDISTIEAGQVQLNLEPVNINSVNQEVRDIFSLQAKKKGIQLVMQNGLPKEESYAITDALKLKQVLINLVGNAMKFTLKGSVHFGYKISNNSIHYFVEDTGTGIEAKNQPYVFDRFRKGENKTNKIQKGTGLGLSISKAYIEHLGGEIHLKSKPGKGTTFSFSLPFNQPKEIIATKTSKMRKPQKVSNLLVGKKLLIAEDDFYVIKFLEMALKPLGLNMVVVNNGRDAEEMVKNDPSIDIILMDIKMPVMNGHEATRIIKKIRPDLPIIVQTAFALSGDEEKALESGCDAYISKPLNRKKLIALIENLLTKQ